MLQALEDSDLGLEVLLELPREFALEDCLDRGEGPLLPM